MNYIFQHLYCFQLFGIRPSLRNAFSSHHQIIFGEPYTLSSNNPHFSIYNFLIPVFPSSYKLITMNPLSASWWRELVNCFTVFLTLVKYLSFPWRKLCQNLTERSYLLTSHMLPRCKFEASALVARCYNAIRSGSQNCRKGLWVWSYLPVCSSVSLSVRVFVCI